jgi:hypothetical protein
MSAITAIRHPARPATSAARILRSFYSRPIAWGGAVVTSAVLAYLGGAVMFWLHAIYRREHGPAIGHVQHWMLDSTLGFVALTPVVFLLLPTVLWLRTKSGPAARVRLGAYVLVVGTLFAVVTGPGPYLHNHLVGAGTPLARFATSVFGMDPGVQAQSVHAVDHSAISEGALQIAVGIPLYSLLTLGAVELVRKARVPNPQG